MLRSSRPALLGLIIAVCLALVAPSAYAAQSPAPTAPTTPSATSGPSTILGHALANVDPVLSKARHALAHVQSIFDHHAAANGQVPATGPDATIALRNLALTYHALPRQQRAAAARILARPDGTGLGGCSADYACYARGATPRVKCEGTICVHWVTAAQDRTNGVPSEDNGHGGAWDGTALNGVPDMVDFTLQQMSYISQSYVDGGYRRPRADGTTGGNADTDIYLANVGNAGVYGYCTPDDPRLNRDLNGRKHWPMSAYCVLDNDFSTREFPRNTPAENLEVTAAHEFFHAVQFAYDADEDAWMMEATAVWAEDELYDSINDNRAYLRSGPMHQPQNPVDLYSGLNEYGAWAFFRFLTERYPDSQGHLPVLVRRIWTRSASYGSGASGMYSLEAIRSVLKHSFHTTLSHQFTRFALANRFPSASYAEGGSYPAARLTLNAGLTPRNPRRETSVNLKHLSARHLRYRPGKGLRAGSHLRIAVTGPAKSVGGAVVVRVKPVGAPMHNVRFWLSPGGDGKHQIAFGKGKVAWVEVAVLNTSAAYRCLVYGSSTTFWTHTCQGKPRRDANRTTVVARALR